MLSTELAHLKAYMAENPGAVIEDVARERKVTPCAVLEAMPEMLVRFGAGSEFVVTFPCEAANTALREPASGSAGSSIRGSAE